MGNQKMKAKSSMIDYGTYQIYLSVDEATCLPITEDVTGTIDGSKYKSLRKLAHAIYCSLVVQGLFSAVKIEN